ncbi:MAG: helix-turn-helix domain-containing protein [Elusimicrobia bacterium]|nr:helix-turn-helix domain-containing protein [Elusimicrobiota bacterium]
MSIAIGNLTFYTVEDLAKKFKVSPATIYEYIKSGKLQAKRFGRKYQISQVAIEKYLTEVN